MPVSPPSPNLAMTRSPTSILSLSYTGKFFLVAGLVGLLAPPALRATPTGSGHHDSTVLRCDGYQATFDAEGNLIKFAGNGTDWTLQPPEDGVGRLEMQGISSSFGRPTKVERSGENACSFFYTCGPNDKAELCLAYSLQASPSKSMALERRLTISCDTPLENDLTVHLPLWQPLGNETWLPRDNGTREVLGTREAAVYQFAGKLPKDGVKLALPLVSQKAPGNAGRITVAADPQFSTLFTRNDLQWTYPKEVGLEGKSEQRVVTTILHADGEDETLAAFFTNMVNDVSPGPKWLHEIALVGFDFMSDGGRGWYADIDALAKRIPQEDRHKVFLCLHGWYDWVGRYSFDEQKSCFDESWTVFGNYERVKEPPKTITIGGAKVDGGFGKCVPVAMTLQEVHARLKYAKSRGFRVGLYFADGMISGKELATFDPKNVLNEGGWQGPDTPGPAYCQNPLAPWVRKFYLAYADALLREFGSEVDGFVWDETFTVRCGSLGSKDVPGYADRALMRLIRQVAQKVQDYNKEHRCELALFTSDCLGTVPGAGPCALAGHGTYQDSWCQPKGWPHAIFPNYRNTVWSCCWWPIHKWDWIEFGVRNYQAPVAITNGWGDNIGFAEMTPEQQQKVIDLFHWRKQRTMRLKPFDTLPEHQ